ncbi:MAG: aspartyl protease family protein [Algibacter sp.]
MSKAFILLLMFLCFCETSFSQDKFVVQNKKGTDKISFKLINNLIIIPVEINGVELSFLLDTGASKSILFNFLNVSDSLNIKNTKIIYLRGLGEGNSIEALKSSGNIIKIGDAIKLNQDLFAVFDFNLNFSSKIGVPIHGIIGYDVLKDFVVEINYSKKYLTLTESKRFRYKKCRNCETLNLEFYNKKPYLNAKITIKEKEIPVKLLIDSGGSDALWLFEDDDLGIVSGDNYFDDFLGHGLSGSVYGKRSKIQGFSLKSFNFKNVNAAFPDASSIAFARQFKNRSGSISGNILKRFNVIVDYRRALITFKKNSKFKDPFRYNKSGLELEHGGLRFVKEMDNTSSNANVFEGSKETHNSIKVVVDTKYKMSLKPAYTVVELRDGSPAHRAGVEFGDVILFINGKPTHEYNLQELMAKFYEREGTRIKLTVDREGTVLKYQFNLESVFK